MTPRTQGAALVAAQFGLLLVLFGAPLVVGAMPDTWAWVCWAAGGVVGLWTVSANRPGNFNIRPEPRRDGHLVQTGPYRWVRHPMYTSVLLLAAGAAAWWGQGIGWALWVALLAVLLAKAWLEEALLCQRYPTYADYQTRSRRLIPWVF